jgi:hypothetical protein
MGRFSVLALIVLSGCAAPAPVYIKTCPVLVNYSRQFDQAAGAQIEALPSESPVTKMISDYIALRAQVRACK